MHDYQQPHSPQTLREGLVEYHRVYPGLLRGEALSPAAREFFRCHDAVHVVYGCDTSLRHEAAVKLASLFGTTGGLGVLRGYALHESRDIYRRLGMRDVLATLGAAAAIVPRTVGRCLRQHKRWPWARFEPLLDQPLDRLRREYGIRVPSEDR